MSAKVRSWRLDAIVLAAGFLCIAMFCWIVSRHRILWSDELFGWMVITDPSWHHALEAWNGGADGGGLLFYILARLWLKLFGQTVLAFRAFSAAGCFVGFAAAWLALRRFYRPWIAALSVFLVWFGSETILWQMIQTRFYGMLLGAAALAFLAAVITPQSPGRGRVAAIVFTAAANLLLVGTHPFGVLYSAAIILGAFVADLLLHRRRLWFYMAAMLPWSFLLTATEAMRNSAKMGKPHFWTTRPTILDLEKWYSPHGLPGFGILLLVLIAALLFSVRIRTQLLQVLRSRAQILCPAIALALMPCFIWLLSQHGTAYFVDRYMIPFTIGIAVLFSEAFTQLSPQLSSIPFPLQKLAFSILLVASILDVLRTALWKYPHDIWVPPYDFTGQLAAALPHNLPVVIERVDTFDMMLADRRAPDLPMYYLLDWDVAIAPSSPRGLASGYHEMAAWKQFGYFSGSILQESDFLRSTKRFVVFSDPDIRWIDYRILHNPDWQATEIGQFKHEPKWSGTIWIVQHR